MIPRVQRILETALYCADLAQTADFYQQLLNVTPMLSGDRLVALDAGRLEGARIPVLEQEEDRPVAGGLVPGHDGSGPVHIAFAVERAHLAAWESRLAHLGIEIESRVQWESGGTSLYFRDPEGRSVELATPGIWPTY